MVKQIVVTAAEMKRADLNTIQLMQMPQLVLMERAALFMEQIIVNTIFPEKAPQNLAVLIVCGTGNNGGDGVALARLLQLRGTCVELIICGESEKYSEGLKSQLSIAEKYGIKPQYVSAMQSPLAVAHLADRSYDLIVDALFGVGLSRSIEGPMERVLNTLNGMKGFKLAADIPSGIHCDTGQVMGAAFQADMTATFGFMKAGLLFYPGRLHAGQVQHDSVGITPHGFGEQPPGGWTIPGGTPWSAIGRARNPAGHKGTFGKVLVIAGSQNAPGAAILSVKAAFAAGAGMVKLMTRECNRDLMIAAVPEVMFTALEDNIDQEAVLAENMDWCDSIVIGPGLGMEASSLSILQAVIAGCHKPLVVDADACNLLAEHGELLHSLTRRRVRGAFVVLTPHLGELSRLTGSTIGLLKQNPLKAARQFVKNTGLCLVAKDAATLVCWSPDTPEDGQEHSACAYYINQSGNCGMSTAGSGDVLSGICGALLAVNSSTDTICQAVYLHGAAGDLAAGKRGQTSMTASDIMHGISELTK